MPEASIAARSAALLARVELSLPFALARRSGCLIRRRAPARLHAVLLGLVARRRLAVPEDSHVDVVTGDRRDRQNHQCAEQSHSALIPCACVAHSTLLSAAIL